MGARVVPIIREESDEVTLQKLHKLNGVLMPGGDADYLEKGLFVFEQAKKINDAGKVFPIWGTCLGYENMVIYSASMGNASLEVFGLHNVSLPLEFTKDPEATKMFSTWKAYGQNPHILSTSNMTWNSHSFSVRPSTFEKDEGLKNFWDVTSISRLDDNTPFVATIEAKKYPFFGVQFHPEQPSTQWIDNYGTNKTWASMQLNHMFGQHFLEIARSNNNTYGTFLET